MRAARARRFDRTPGRGRGLLCAWIALSVVALSGCGGMNHSTHSIRTLPSSAATATCLDGVVTISFAAPPAAFREQARACGDLATAVREASTSQAAHEYAATIAIVARDHHRSPPAPGTAAYERIVRAIAVDEIAAMTAGVTERRLGDNGALLNGVLDRGFPRTASVSLLWVTLERLFAATGCIEPTQSEIDIAANQTIDHDRGAKDLRAALPGLVSSLAIIHACDLGKEMAESVAALAHSVRAHMSDALAEREARRLHLQRLPSRGTAPYDRLVRAGLRSYVRTTAVAVAATVALSTAPVSGTAPPLEDGGPRRQDEADASDFFPLHSPWLTDRADAAVAEAVSPDVR